MHGAVVKEKLGEILVREGWITGEQRDWATGVQERTGCRLGAILIAAGLVRRTAVYRVLARTWDCDYVDLADTSLDLSLLDGLDPHVLGEEGWLPYRRNGDRIVVATSERPTAERQALVEDRLGAPAELVVTTDWDILQSLHQAFRDTVVEQSTRANCPRTPCSCRCTRRPTSSRTSSRTSARSTTRARSSRSCCCSRRTTPRPSRRPARRGRRRRSRS